jgi:hypothetical protein
MVHPLLRPFYKQSISHRCILSSQAWFEAILWRSASPSMSEEPSLPYGNQKYHGFEFMDSPVADMVHDDPAKRPRLLLDFSRLKAGLLHGNYAPG